MRGVRALLGLYPRNTSRVPHISDFLSSFVGSLNFMRLSLMKGAHAVLSRAAYTKFGDLARFSRDVGYHGSSLKLLRAPQFRTGAPPTSVARISYCPALATGISRTIGSDKQGSTSR